MKETKLTKAVMAHVSKDTNRPTMTTAWTATVRGETCVVATDGHRLLALAEPGLVAGQTWYGPHALAPDPSASLRPPAAQVIPEGGPQLLMDDPTIDQVLARGRGRPRKTWMPTYCLRPGEGASLDVAAYLTPGKRSEGSVSVSALYLYDACVALQALADEHKVAPKVSVALGGDLDPVTLRRTIGERTLTIVIMPVRR